MDKYYLYYYYRAVCVYVCMCACVCMCVFSQHNNIMYSSNCNIGHLDASELGIWTKFGLFPTVVNTIIINPDYCYRLKYFLFDKPVCYDRNTCSTPNGKSGTILGTWPCHGCIIIMKHFQFPYIACNYNPIYTWRCLIKINNNNNINLWVVFPKYKTMASIIISLPPRSYIPCTISFHYCI